MSHKTLNERQGLDSLFGSYLSPFKVLEKHGVSQDSIVEDNNDLLLLKNFIKKVVSYGMCGFGLFLPVLHTFNAHHHHAEYNRNKTFMIKKT
jgi:hypothetical protein